MGKQDVQDDHEADFNADLSQVTIVDTENSEWQGSPANGVERKRLYLAGEEEPKLTTLVRFAANSYFNQHTHDGGEEFFVLQGTFSDHSGDYHAGTYVRNPPGTEHKPFTKPGCTIFVKLRQFETGDSKQFSINTLESEWIETAIEGVEKITLHAFDESLVSLLKIQKNAELVIQTDKQLNELFVISGEIEIDNKTYQAGSWMRFPENYNEKITAKSEVQLYHYIN